MIDPESRAPRDQVSSFASDANTIYAVLAVNHIAAGTSVQALWSYNRTRLDTFDQAIVAEAEGTNTWLEFHLALTQPGTWPRGTYEVSIMVDGEPAVTGSVEVVDGGS